MKPLEVFLVFVIQIIAVAAFQLSVAMWFRLPELESAFWLHRAMDVLP